MSLIPKLMQIYFAPRIKQIEHFKNHPIEVQHKQYELLVKACSKTALGKEFGVVEGLPYSEFRKRVPVMEYPTFERFIDRVRAGEDNVIWPGKIANLAQSSGTTAGHSKYIPITKEGIKLLRIIVSNPAGYAVTVGYAIAYASNLYIAFKGNFIYVLTGKTC